ncbi:MAG: nickel-dependent hydrogenase large subunit [Longimicrobiales bacterium]|nr:nickel-dependent hydrogenase large subunit [Longimicrobiales bacterium]
MCFKNLPIEFDAQGVPTLKEGVADPYGVEWRGSEGVPRQLSHTDVEELLKRNGHIRSVDYDPVTRVAGALAFHSVADLEKREVLEARSVATLFRGYEIIMIGRDPRDAIFITSRACGVCGGVHSATAAMATEMAIGCCPPPQGVLVRNLALALEFMYDHPLHLFLLAGPDYSQSIVEATTPSLWEKAKKAEAPSAEIHGYTTVGEMMADLNPLQGKLYLEALQMTRVAREAYVLIAGKYPHPQTMIPGGMSTTLTLSVMNEMYTRLSRFFDYSKKVQAFWDDITTFFYEADPRYKEVGGRRATMIDTGIFDLPDAYDATYANAAEWGDRRWATPGVIVDGELVTTDLHQINMGLEEFVEHSYYEDWAGNGRPPRYPEDEKGMPLSPWHPWNKVTKPRPQGQDWKERYTWDTAPRWDREAMEAGAYSRLWSTAAARKLPENPFIESRGDALGIELPRGTLPKLEMEWKVPDTWNAFERNRGRAYCLGFTTMVAMNNWLRIMDRLKDGDTKVSTDFEIPKDERIGVGFWGAGRGYLTHHLVMDRGAVTNYQILTPSTWNASPTDRWGQPGPYEEAVLNTPILEEFDDPESFQGVDILRAIRSFDPCMPCTTHIQSEAGMITREVNTCACGVD